MNWQCYIYLAIAIGFGPMPSPCVAEAEATVTLRFLSIPLVADAEPVMLSVGDDKTMEILTPTNALSPPYQVKARSRWIIVGSVMGDGGESTTRELGSAAALDSPDQLIVLVRKGEDEGGGLDVIPIDSRPEWFGGGKFLFINATEYEFGGEVGGFGFSIDSGQYSIAEPKPESEKSKLCHGTLYYTKEGKEKPFFTSKWPVSNYARGLFFFYQDFRTSRLRLHTIRDFL